MCMSDWEPRDDHFLARSKPLGNDKRGEGQILTVLRPSIDLKINGAGKLVVELLIEYAALKLQQEAMNSQVDAFLEIPERAIDCEKLPMLENCCKFTSKFIVVNGQRFNVRAGTLASENKGVGERMGGGGRLP